MRPHDPEPAPALPQGSYSLSLSGDARFHWPGSFVALRGSTCCLVTKLASTLRLTKVPAACPVPTAPARFLPVLSGLSRLRGENATPPCGEAATAQ